MYNIVDFHFKQIPDILPLFCTSVFHYSFENTTNLHIYEYKGITAEKEVR